MFATDLEGNVIANGRDVDISYNLSGESWFKEVSVEGKVVVTDLHYSDIVKGLALAYSCPVRDSKNNIVGTFTTRFNWEFIFEIIDSAKLSPKTELYLITKDGIVIGSKNNRSDVLRKDISKTEVFREIKRNKIGYILNSGNIEAFALTKGYNEYKGLEWSVVIIEPID